MSSYPEPTSEPTRPPRRSPLRDLALVLLPVLLIGGAVIAYFYITEYRSVVPIDFSRGIRGAVTNPEKLADTFTDADGDLVADAPKDPDKQIDPKTLTFSTLDPDLDKSKAEWKEFLAFLAKTTGKKVELSKTPAGGQAVVEEMKAGKLHIATLSTGTVPLAVNTGGFVPCCVMADENGNYAYQMEVLVRADGPIQSLADLKGRTLTLTSLSSLSSFKAPVVLLRKHGLRPDVDYKIRISAGQRVSIQDLAQGEAEAIAVANDYMKRVLRDEKLSEKEFRTIHKSESYPPACFGHVSTLKPELAKKVRSAFLDFDWKGTGLEKAYRPANQVKFVKVDYKKDWKPVRDIDRAILELVGKD